MSGIVVQGFIFIFSASAIWFVSQNKSYRPVGYLIGLFSQPFWFYTTITNDQWGLILLSLFYTYSWSMGVYNFTIPYFKELKKHRENKYRKFNNEKI